MAMAEWRVEHDWSIAASLMALIANIHRDPKKMRTVRPTDFYKPRQRAKPPRQKGDITMLRDLWVKPTT